MKDRWIIYGQKDNGCRGRQGTVIIRVKNRYVITRSEVIGVINEYNQPLFDLLLRKIADRHIGLISKCEMPALDVKHRVLAGSFGGSSIQREIGGAEGNDITLLKL